MNYSYFGYEEITPYSFVQILICIHGSQAMQGCVTGLELLIFAKNFSENDFYDEHLMTVFLGICYLFNAFYATQMTQVP